MKRLLLVLCSSLLLWGCESPVLREGEDSPVEEQPEAPTRDKYGLWYLYDGITIPEIHVSISVDEWNRLLSLYDSNPKTKQYVHCDVSYLKGEDTTVITDAGIRLRGNTSRRRPEGNNGQTHEAGNSDWHHCHFGLNLRKYHKDSDHEINGARKMNLKWFKDDPNYVRELYCYDLFRRDSVWTAPNAVYSRLWIKVEGDPQEVYYGVYEMIEPIDSRYLKAREEQFGGSGGNLWKCRWGASLSSTNADFGLDDGSDAEHVYEMKTDDNDYAAAEAQLKDFILKLTGKSDESFYEWIQEVCDVPLLLRTYAVNVTVGMWDDYWNNKNNYYLYFNTTDKYNYKFFFIPYDYDNTLGTSSMMDSGTQDPFNWGDNSNLLIYRVLKFPQFREIYKEALLELVDPDKALFYYTASIRRITEWQTSIRGYVSNDTGEDCKVYDAPAYWSNKSEYTLLKEGQNNFFQVRTKTINKYCQ